MYLCRYDCLATRTYTYTSSTGNQLSYEPFNYTLNTSQLPDLLKCLHLSQYDCLPSLSLVEIHVHRRHKSPPNRDVIPVHIAFALCSLNLSPTQLHVLDKHNSRRTYDQTLNSPNLVILRLGNGVYNPSVPSVLAACCADPWLDNIPGPALITSRGWRSGCCDGVALTREPR